MFSFSGNLDSVNPATGAVSVIGATGLGGYALCTAVLGGTVYETDFYGNLYKVNTTSGPRLGCQTNSTAEAQTEFWERQMYPPLLT